MSQRRLVVALLACAAMTACSASKSGSNHADVGNLVDGGDSASQAPGTAGGPSASPSAHSSKGSHSASPSAGGTSSAPDGSTDPGQGGSSADGPVPNADDHRVGVGVTPTTISLGFTYSGDQSSASKSLGGSGGSDPQRPSEQAVIDYVNKHGGIAGRKIVPVWFNIQYTNGSTDAQRAQQECATFTEDHKVFAAGPFPTITEVQPTCLQKAGSIAMFSMTGIRLTFDDVDAKKFGNALWSPNVPTIDRTWTALVKAASKANYFTKGAKIGAVIYNTAPYQRSVNNTLIPALKQQGAKLAEVCKIRVAADVNDIAGVETDSQNCALKFKSDGIDHVMGGAPVVSMMVFSSGQKYYPRFALQSGALGVDKNLNGADISRNFKDMVATGWVPDRDVGATAPTPFSTTCLNIIKAAGVKVTVPYEAWSYCDYVFFVKAALEHAPTFTQAGFAAGAKLVGNAFNPSMTLQTLWSDGRHDGPSVYRNVVYDFNCHNAGKKECFKYTGSPVPF